jgi:hypothetical protein
MMFASVTPPVEIAAWLGCLTFLVMLANGVLKLVDRAKGRPTPGEVQSEAAEKFARKIEFDRHLDANEQAHRDLFSKLGGVERGARENLEKKFDLLRNERAHDIANIQSELNAISKQLGVVSAQNEFQNNAMKEVKDFINRWLGRSKTT